MPDETWRKLENKLNKQKCFIINVDSQIVIIQVVQLYYLYTSIRGLRFRTSNPLHRPGIVPIELHHEQETVLVKIHIIQINSLITDKNGHLQRSVVAADALYNMFVPSMFCT